MAQLLNSLGMQNFAASASLDLMLQSGTSAYTQHCMLFESHF
jgi:hypothetical protein